MSGNEAKDNSSTKVVEDKQADVPDELVNPDSNIDDAPLDGNEGKLLLNHKKIEEDKNQEGDNEQAEGGQDHGEGEEAGSYKRKN
jgi:hypothetical protein